MLILVVTACAVFVGTFFASLFIPNYQFAAIAAPVMTATIGLVAGVGLSRKQNGEPKEKK